MSLHARIRYQRLIREAEGYLELGLPRLAAATIERVGPRSSLKGNALYLLGEALRAMEQYSEAVDVLTAAAEKSPGKVDIYLALGWCHKRLRRIDLAIDDLRRAVEIDPKPALLHYNLACYWSLAGNKERALYCLGEALRIDGNFRDLIGDEHDFDPLRNDADFQSLIGGKAQAAG